MKPDFIVQQRVPSLASISLLHMLKGFYERVCCEYKSGARS